MIMAMRPLKIHVLDVGHGDTIILEMPKGANETIFGVVDCVKYDSVVKQYLDKLGAKHLAFVVATHPHDDHISGIEALLRAYQGKVGEFWDSGFIHYSDTYLDLLTYVEGRDDLIVEFIDSGSITRFGKVKLNVLAPPDRLLIDAGKATNVNNASIVIRVEYGKSKILLSGDAQFGSWSHMRINHKDELRAQALKVAHHGSKHGNFLEALEIVNPNYAIISAGNRDLEKFPHKSTIEALKEVVPYKTRIYNTKELGHVIITSTGTTRLSVDWEKKE
jgi:competence protein ComEC